MKSRTRRLGGMLAALVILGGLAVAQHASAASQAQASIVSSRNLAVADLVSGGTTAVVQVTNPASGAVLALEEPHDAGTSVGADKGPAMEVQPVV